MRKYIFTQRDIQVSVGLMLRMQAQLSCDPKIRQSLFPSPQLEGRSTGWFGSGGRSHQVNLRMLIRRQ